MAKKQDRTNDGYGNYIGSDQQSQNNHTPSEGPECNKENDIIGRVESEDEIHHYYFKNYQEESSFYKEDAEFFFCFVLSADESRNSR